MGNNRVGIQESVVIGYSCGSCCQKFELSGVHNSNKKVQDLIDRVLVEFILRLIELYSIRFSCDLLKNGYNIVFCSFSSERKLKTEAMDEITRV
jgi:hypothetical protein